MPRDVLATAVERVVRLDLDLWAGPVTETEQRILSELDGPVLDVGCGPGRLVAALRNRGVHVLGIDAAPAAIACAEAQGRRVVQRSVFDAIPHEGAWSNVLLFDGNIGIGGDPGRLLRRVGELMDRDGRAIVELEPPGGGLEFGVVEFEVATGMVGWFPWCWVGAEEIAQQAEVGGLHVDDCRSVDGRWFAWLRRA